MNAPANTAQTQSMRWWDLACVGVVLVIVVVVCLDSFAGDPQWAAGLQLGWRIAIMLTPLALFVALYVALGRGVIARGMAGLSMPAYGGVYISGTLVTLVAGAFLDPMYAMLQALIYPVVWSIVENYRSAVMWSVAVALAVGAGIFVGLTAVQSSAAVLSSLATASVSLVFAVSMGTWITSIHDRGESYRELSERLRRSQDEVAELSAAAGAATERDRMSRDLHDTLTQTLTGLVMLSEQTERALDANDEARARNRLARVSAAARTAVTEARALVATTQPIGEDGLIRAIERVAAGLSADTGLHVECELTQLQIGREREVVLLRAVQEGLANARKHARAQLVTVSLVPTPDNGARLVVEDDGVGPGQHLREGGYGLTGLTDRVRHVGGSVRFGDRAGGGFRLDVELLPQPAAGTPDERGLEQ